MEGARTTSAANCGSVGGGGGGILMGYGNPNTCYSPSNSSPNSPSSPSSSHSSMDIVNPNTTNIINNNPLLFHPTANHPIDHHHNHHQQQQLSLIPSPYYFMDTNNTINNNNNFINTSISVSLPTDPPPPQPLVPNHNNSITTVDHLPHNHGSNISMRAKIMSHPHFPRLLSAFSNCHKVGAPAEVVARLEEVCGSGAAAAAEEAARSSSSSGGGCLGEDPALDQFMEAYCEMLTKYEQELSKPFKEALLFLSRIESQFRALTLSTAALTTSPNNYSGDLATGRNSSEDDMDVPMEIPYIDPQAEDKELKVQLLRRYSGYIGNLKQEFLKKKKKGKLPKEARQQLLEWWNRHYKWPYPSETQKVALAEATGLDQKQINNWFINQRKRHWKPTEDMQFVVMDAANYPHYYLDHHNATAGVMGGNNHVGNSAFPLDFNSSASHHHHHL